MNLQLRPAKVVVDQNGYWTHPDYPDFDEGISRAAVEEVFESLGVRTKAVWMESDLADDHPVLQGYFDARLGATGWNPTCPPGEGWFLISIHDTDEGDGPVAIFAQPA